MKTFKTTLSICIYCISILSAQIPTFKEGRRITYFGRDLRNVYSNSSTGYNYYAVPCVTDWNGDGKKDLLVGNFYKGWIHLYLNSGTNNQPVFRSETRMQANSADISVGYG